MDKGLARSIIFLTLSALYCFFCIAHQQGVSICIGLITAMMATEFIMKIIKKNNKKK